MRRPSPGTLPTSRFLTKVCIVHRPPTSSLTTTRRHRWEKGSHGKSSLWLAEQNGARLFGAGKLVRSLDCEHDKAASGRVGNNLQPSVVYSSTCRFMSAGRVLHATLAPPPPGAAALSKGRLYKCPTALPELRRACQSTVGCRGCIHFAAVGSRAFKSKVDDTAFRRAQLQRPASSQCRMCRT